VEQTSGAASPARRLAPLTVPLGAMLGGLEPPSCAIRLHLGQDRCGERRGKGAGVMASHEQTHGGGLHGLDRGRLHGKRRGGVILVSGSCTDVRRRASNTPALAVGARRRSMPRRKPGHRVPPRRAAGLRAAKVRPDRTRVSRGPQKRQRGVEKISTPLYLVSSPRAIGRSADVGESNLDAAVVVARRAAFVPVVVGCSGCLDRLSGRAAVVRERSRRSRGRRRRRRRGRR
jgi:hypothetical protein